MDTRLLRMRELERGCTNLPLCKELSQIDEKLIYHVDREIMSHTPDVGVLENIDVFLDNCREMQPDTPFLKEADRWYNSFPFGEKTGEVFPRFLGICRGKTKLKAVLDAALDHCVDVVRKYGSKGAETCTVMILTDKWDEKTFKEFEERFLKHTALDGIWFVFLLATDNGYTQISFVDNDMYSYTKSYRE